MENFLLWRDFWLNGSGRDCDSIIELLWNHVLYGAKTVLVLSCCVYDSVWICWYSLAYLQLWSLSLVEFFRLSNAFIENENKWVFFIPKDWNERDKFAILGISGLSERRDHSNGNCIPDRWWAREIIGVEIFCRCVERKRLQRSSIHSGALKLSTRSVSGNVAKSPEHSSDIRNIIQRLSHRLHSG